jgi:hypothetical protein
LSWDLVEVLLSFLLLDHLRSCFPLVLKTAFRWASYLPAPDPPWLTGLERAMAQRSELLLGQE